MSGLGDFVKKAEEWAEENPEMTRKGIDQAEQFVQDQTDHRYDDQISAGADKLADRLTNGQGQQGQQGQSQGSDQNWDNNQQNQDGGQDSFQPQDGNYQDGQQQGGQQ